MIGLKDSRRDIIIHMVTSSSSSKGQAKTVVIITRKRIKILLM